MNDAEERVLEHALREILRQESSDLPGRVLKAWRTSQDPGRAARRPFALPTSLAAALLAALLAGVFAIRAARRSPATGPAEVATSSEALDVLRPGDPQRRPRSSFRDGDTLVNGPERERELTLVGGASITLGRCSMLAFARTDAGLTLTPLVGQVTLRGEPPAGARLHTPLGDLALAGAGALRIDVQADGYGLEHPERFHQLVKEIHMKSAIPIVLTSIAILQGNAVLEAPGGRRELAEGESVQSETGELDAEAIEEKLLQAIGTWELTVTEIGRDGKPRRTYAGEEVCGAGPGDKWLVTDMTLHSSTPPVTIHTVVGFEARKQRYTGTLYDSFGGEMGLLRGTPGDDLDRRTLSMYSAEGTPGFDIRWHMRWVSADERRTRMELLQDGEWLPLREIVHRRRN